MGGTIRRPQGLERTAPPGADSILFTLNSVEIEGMSVFDSAQFAPLFEHKIGQEIPSSFLWELSARITKTYRDQGYFLCRASVPAQKIESGNARIAVIEGYIADVKIEGKGGKDALAKDIIQDILAQRPTNIEHLENLLLRLNDIYGLKFDASLAKKEDGQDGTAVLKLATRAVDQARITVSTNNYGSRFVGPQRGAILFENSFLDHHKTSLSAEASIPKIEELVLASLNHKVQIAPAVELDFLVSHTRSEPGFTLRESEIKSSSFAWGVGAKWKLLRQRAKNLTLSVRFDALNSNTDTFDTTLTRDRVRALRASAIYDFRDQLSGQNALSLTVSRGIGLFGASDEGDSNLSRADADPDFTKFAAFYNRQDLLGRHFLLNTTLSGQYTSESLFSSEEFGFGGARLGRAYDSSEITGDQGIAASIELNYLGFNSANKCKVNPFIFYDIGKIWNEGNASIDNISAASGGIGTRAYCDNGLSFDASLAFPLTKPIDTPVYGTHNKSPVLRFGLNYQFGVDETLRKTGIQRLFSNHKGQRSSSLN